MSHSSTSITVTTTPVLSEACCDPGSATSYPASLSFPPGHEVKLGGVDCYSVNEQSRHVVIYGTDIFGYRFVNNRQNADQIAAGGFHVVIPDMFGGGAVTDEDIKSKGAVWLQTEWFASYSQQQTVDKLEAVAQAIKDEGKADSVQAIGYCYGTYGVLHLYQKELATAGMVAHPTGFNKDNVAQCNQPTLFNCAQADHRFTPDIRQHWEQTLRTNNVPCKFVDYPGTQHGFAVRDDGSEVGVAARQRAIEETVAWLKQRAEA